MDNNTDPIAVAEANAPSEVINKGEYTLEKVNFGKGKKEGFSYYTPQYNNLAVVCNLWGKGNAEEGEKLVVGFLNTAIRNSFGGRATQRMPSADKDEDTKKLIADALTKGDTVLISSKDADEWVPGTRDRVSLITLTKEFNDAIKAGDADKAQEIFEEIKAEQQRKMDEMLKLASSPVPTV